MRIGASSVHSHLGTHISIHIGLGLEHVRVQALPQELNFMDLGQSPREGTFVSTTET